MRDPNFNIDDLISDLNGTCKNLDEALPDGMKFEDLTTEENDKIDEEIFQCENCGWWEEQGLSTTIDGDELCNDCAEEY